MNEPRKENSKPRWPVTLSAEEEAAFADFEGNCSLPSEAPRIDTRILTRGRSCSLALTSLSEVTGLTRKLADYAGYDLLLGPNPDFADLRSVCDDLTKLTCEPFGEGIFIIPARLEADPVQLPEGDTLRRVETDDVAKRFGKI